MSATSPARRGVLALVFVLACLPFLPSLAGEFVDWDDRQNFLDNPHYRGFSLANLRWMFTSIHMGHYMPVTWLSSALDYELWGMDPTGYHLTNVLLHGLVAVLLAIVLERLLASAAPGAPTAALRGSAAVGALLYAVHPLRVESVAWATERRDVLSGALLLLSLLAWLRHLAGGPGAQRLRTLSLVAFALSLLAKTAGMVFPLVLVVLDAYPLGRLARGPDRRRPWRARLAEKAPWFTLGALGAWVGWLGQMRTAGALTTLADLGLAERAAIALNGLVFYPWKSLWPAGLAPLYPLELAPALSDPRTLLNAALLVGAAALAVVLRRRRPALAAALASYVALIAPVVGLAHAGRHYAADRYSYLATMPFAALAAGLLLRRPRLRAAAPAIVLVLGALAWRQTGVWRDSIALWERVARTAPHSHVGHHRLGVELHLAGRDEEALVQLERALALRPGPDPDDARYDTAEVLYALGELERAEAALRDVLETYPTHLGALLRLAHLYRLAGEEGRALELGRRAVALDPDDAAARTVLGLALRDAGRVADAELQLRRALALDPGNAAVARALAALRLQQPEQQD